MRIIFAVILFVFAGFTELKAQTHIADSLFTIGQELSSEADYVRAGEYFQKSMQLYLQEKDSVKWIEASLEYGETLVHRGSVSEGLTLFLELDETSVRQIPTPIVVTIKNNIGLSYRNLEQYSSAREYYLAGIEMAEGTRDSLLIGRLNNNISYTYQRTGDYETAFLYQKKAKKIYEDLNASSRLSFVLNGMFLTLMDLGLYKQAEPYIRQSLAIREKLNNPDLLDIAYHNLAFNFENQGKRDSSIIYYQKSLELSRMLDNSFDITQTLLNIGSLYERSGNSENALQYYNEALEVNYGTNRPVSISNNLSRLAGVAMRTNDYENAEAFYRESLMWLLKTDAPINLTNRYLDIASLEMRKNNHSKALDYISKADSISYGKGFNSQKIRSYILQGNLHKKRGDLAQSLAKFRNAYKLTAERTITSKISPTVNLAKAYNAVSSDSAFILADEAFTLIDSIRTSVAGLSFRTGFFRNHGAFYNEVASWYITQKNNPDKAFELIEAAKARVLMDELAEAQERIYESAPEDMLIQKQQLAKQIDRQYHLLSEAKTPEEEKLLNRELKDLEFRYQSLLNEIRLSLTHAKRLEYPRPTKASQAMKLLSKNTGIIEYAFTGEKLIRFLITSENIQASVIDSLHGKSAKTYLLNQVELLREDISDEKPLEKFEQTAAELTQILIPDLSRHIKELVIIPGGALTFLPFEVLRENGQYLIEKYKIKYLPSVSIFDLIQEPHRPASYEILAMAGSGFESGDAISPLRSQVSYASLPSTLLEVDSIAAHFGTALVLKNEEVTEESIKSLNLNDFRFLHFATHGVVDETNPMRSGLLLSRTDQLEKHMEEDGFLNSIEISGLELNADLVTLSACNTGIGKIVTGEGLIGLQRSFFSAGASSVMSSLWSVYDRSTAVFMSKFYRKMQNYEKEDFGLWNQALNWAGLYSHPLVDYKVTALREAKMEMINHPYYHHPVHWAPFILTGK